MMPKLPHPGHGPRLGVELEVIAPDIDGRRAICRAGRHVAAEASLGRLAVEVRWAGRPRIRYYESLARRIDAIRAVPEARVTTRCGLHVHVERKPGWAAAVLRWVLRQKEIRALFPERDGSPFCLPVRSVDDVRSHFRAVSRSRAHRTLEFRLHPGTLQWPAAVCWADLCAAMVEARASLLGEAYLDARRWAVRHTGKPQPVRWYRQIRAVASVAGYAAAMIGIAGGEFREWQESA